MHEVNCNQEALKHQFVELNEFKHVLTKTRLFFDEVSICVLIFLYYTRNSIL